MILTTSENIKLDDEDFVSETFAFILLNKNFNKAIEIYDKLKHRHPENYFIKKINELLKLQQLKY